MRILYFDGGGTGRFPIISGHAPSVAVAVDVMVEKFVVVGSLNEGTSLIFLKEVRS